MSNYHPCPASCCECSRPYNNPIASLCECKMTPGQLHATPERPQLAPALQLRSQLCFGSCRLLFTVLGKFAPNGQGQAFAFSSVSVYLVSVSTRYGINLQLFLSPILYVSTKELSATWNIYFTTLKVHI